MPSSFNGNKLFTLLIFFGDFFFDKIFKFIYFHFKKNGIFINIQGLTSPNKLGATWNQFSASIVDCKFLIILSTKRNE